MLREAPSRWRKVKLEEACGRITVGHVGPMSKEYVENGIPFLRSQNVQPFRIDQTGIKFITPAFHGKLEKSALRPGDIVVVRTGFPGTAAVIPPSLSIANCADLVIIHPSEQVDPWFLASVFNSAWGKGVVAGNLVGVAQQHFNVGAAKRLEVYLPPIATQRKIASILSAYDDLIENNTRRIAILEEMARRIYEEWFVHFRFPGHKNVRMVESELGLMPEGWEIAALSEHVSLDRGVSYKGAYLSPDGVPMVNLKNFLPGGGFRREGFKFYSGNFKSRHVVKYGDIVLANTDLTQAGNVIGSPAIVPRGIPGQKVIITHHVFAVRAGSDAPLGSYYLYHLLGDRSFKEFARGRASGTTVLGLHKDAVMGFHFVLPPAPLRNHFNEMCQNHYALTECIEEKNANLHTQRDLLLPKLISGEIDVSEAEINMEEVA